MFARAIHSASRRADKLFVAINCAAIPESLLESELFGYEAGAFTGAAKEGKAGKFELADKGTIFLDEIGDMPLHLQVKLLRVLQERTIERIGGLKSIPVDVRIIAATNNDLEDMIEHRVFREDLYFRLNVIPIHINALRERPGDIDDLLDFSLEKFNRILGKRILGFSAEARDLLRAYGWPGNVRELENAVEHSVNLQDGTMIEPEDLPDRIRRLTNLDGSATAGVSGTLKECTDAAQRGAITGCLDRTGRSLAGKRAAAKQLGVSDATLYRKIKELGIS
jgi:transcriptional regulator with PAS, ATPase and Fis domain